jgi:predicted type IV restriction endonuclease/tRNA1(Val) A37 N6-methylase TrmN6
MLTKEEAKERVKELVKEFSEIPKSQLNEMKEDQIKWLFIEPLFEALGWEKKDIEKEATVLKGRADYLLRNENKGALVIEAKKTSVSLLEEEGRQAVSYAYHQQIKFAVLTNFKSLRVYHALSKIKNINKNLLKVNNNYFILDYTEFLDKFDIVWLLSKESFEKGEINKLLSLKDERINKPIDKSILEDLLQSRKWLSTELKSKKPYLEKEVIDEIVQILIDRLIFIRSVEDRKLENENFLLGLDSDVRQQRVKLQLFPYLIETFEEFNKKYDSKLFEKGLLEKEGAFSDEVLHKVIKALYFGDNEDESKYMFDIIPGDLFGNIYEQYLGTILAETEKRVKLEGGTGKRKKMGIYYTPSYIVDYIVKNTVGEYIKNKTIDEILEVNIVDPACGSGSFLIRAFKEVCDKIEELLKDKQFSGRWSDFKSYNNRLTFSQKVSILKNCIYGVDLDEKAVELARLNLMLKTLEGEGPDTKSARLPELVQIKCGNSLIDDSKISERAFNWHAQFPDVFKNGGFDVVIGNPPYVNNITLPEKDKKFYSEKYSSAIEQFDLYILFFEKGEKILKENGVLGFITPNKFFIAKYGKEIRRFLLEEVKITKLIDVSNLTVFKEASTYPVITLTKKSKKGVGIIEIGLNITSESNFFNKNYITTKIDQDKFSKMKDFVFEIHVQMGDSEIFDKISKDSLPLSEVLDVKKGIETGGDKDFVISAKEIINIKPTDKKFLVNLIASRDINKYFIDWSGKEIIYDVNRLKGPRNKGIFEEEKLVTCRTVKQLSFAYDAEKRYLTDTCQILLLNNDKFNLKFVLAILNSKLINFFYGKKFESSHMRGGYFRCFKQYLDQIPIRLPSPSQEKHIVSLVDQMLELQKKYHNEKIQGNEKERLKQQIDNVDYEIDQEVYKLYELTSEEIKIVEEILK